MTILLHNHIIKLLIKRKHTPNSQLHLGNITSKQQQIIKDSIININN